MGMGSEGYEREVCFKDILAAQVLVRASACPFLLARVSLDSCSTEEFAAMTARTKTCVGAFCMGNHSRCAMCGPKQFEGLIFLSGSKSTSDNACKTAWSMDRRY